jgi:hypothetical protein
MVGDGYTMRRLTAPDKILELLAKERWLNKYQMKKKTALSYSRVHESAQRLEEQGLIKGKVVGKAPTGLSKKAYSLTLNGLNYVASQSMSDLDALMENYEDLLPLIAGKWDFIKRVTKKWEIPHIYERHFATYEPPLDADSYAEEVLSNFLRDNFDVEPRYVRIVKAFSEDPDFKRLLYKMLKELRKWHCNKCRLMDKSLRILKKSRSRKGKGKRKGR